MGLGRRSVFIDKPIFEAKLKFAFFRLGPDQKIYRFIGGNIGQIRLIKINQGIQTLVSPVIPNFPGIQISTGSA